MADKISTLILTTVDLECCRCYKKIQKVINKFPEIQNQIFHKKKNKVIVSGPFDPEKIKRKLYCKACKYFKDIRPPSPPPPPPPPVPLPEPVLPVPGMPVGPYAPMVCCKPCCVTCVGHPEPGTCTRFRYEPGTCNCIFFSEEDPSCSIM